MRHLCAQAGFDLVPFLGEADVYVINTCTVTSEADREGRRLARQARRRAPEGARVVIAGCSAQANQDGMRIPEADLLLGNAEKMCLPEHLRKPTRYQEDPSRLGSSLPEIRAAPIQEQSQIGVFPLPYFGGRKRAYLKIQDGCNFSCTFCATTLARGTSRSLDPEECLEHARRLGKGGHKEVVLTGIHLGAYGRDLNPRQTLSRLLERVIDTGGVGRVRLSSVEPGEVTRELVRVGIRSAFGNKKAGRPYLCRHYHIPAQSGDDGILRKMGRNYTAGLCARRFSELAGAIPGVCLGADFIVGFPGESKQAFERSLEWVREAPVAYLHVFPYSPRKNTPAASFEGRLHGTEAKRRVHALQELGRRKWASFIASQSGTEVEVLFEGRRDDGLLSGLTDNYVRVLTAGPDEWIGNLVAIRLEPEMDSGKRGSSEARGGTLSGVAVG